MDDKDLTRKLEGADPPQVELPHARAQLRRELLTSSDFAKPKGDARGVRFGIAAVGAVVVAIVLVIQLTPDRLSAKALIDSIESAYDARAVEDAVHYLRQTLRLSNDRHFEVESWSQRSEGRVRMQLTDVSSGELLAHRVFEGDHMYGLATASSAPHSVNKITVGHHQPEEDRDHARMLAVVIMRVSEGDAWEDETIVQALVLDNGYNRDAFARKTPQDVVRDLRKSENVEYAGAAFSPDANAKLETLEIRNSGALPFKLEFPLKHMEQVRWFLSSVISEHISLEMDGRFVEFLEQNDLEGEIKLRPIESSQRVEVLPGSASIYRTTLVIRENGIETYRAENTFLEDRYLPFTPETFDPGALGLTLLEPAPQEPR